MGTGGADGEGIRPLITSADLRAFAERVRTPRPQRGASWSTRPTPPRTKSRAEIEAERRREAQRVDWAHRHPELAAAERAFRKDRVSAVERYGHKPAGTPETHQRAARRAQGALARLYQSGGISADQLAWAVEIAAVAERIGADVAVRTAQYETGIDRSGRGDAAFYERLHQVRMEMAYTRWRTELGGHAAPVLDMIVGETIGYSVVATRYRMSAKRAKRLLIEALDRWPRIRRGVTDEVDGERLHQAHAALIGCASSAE